MKKKHFSLMGDFNLDLSKYNVHEKTTDFVDNIISHGCLPTIHKPTRVTTESATIIDHIYVNYATHKSKSGIIITDVSDHFGILYLEDRSSKHISNEMIEKRIYSEKNIIKFRDHLRENTSEMFWKLNVLKIHTTISLTLSNQLLIKLFLLQNVNQTKNTSKRHPGLLMVY